MVSTLVTKTSGVWKKSTTLAKHASTLGGGNRGQQPFSTRALRRGARSFDTKNIVRLFEYLIIVGLAIVFAMLVYAVFAPLPAPTRLPINGAPTQSAVSDLIEANANPFRVAVNKGGDAVAIGAMDEEEIEETTLNLVLHGVRVDESRRTAIIRLPSGEQRSFRVGDEIISGVTLNDAYQDQVTITRRGVRETLTLVNRDPKVVRANRKASTSKTSKPISNANNNGQSDGPIEINSISKYLRVTPAASSNGLRVMLNPGPDGTLFRQSGLKPGDILLELDGRSVTRDPSSILTAIQDLAPGEEISISVERGGEFVPLVLEVPQIAAKTSKGAE